MQRTDTDTCENIPSLSGSWGKIVIIFSKQITSSYKVQTPSGVYSYWRSAVQELSAVDLKICQSVCTVQLKTSSTFYRMTTGRTSLLKLSMVGQLTTDWGRLFQSRMVSGKKDLW